MVRPLLRLLCVLGVMAVLSLPARAVGMAENVREVGRLDAAWSDSALRRDADPLASFHAEDAVVYPADDVLIKGRGAARKYRGGGFWEQDRASTWKSVQDLWNSDAA